MSSVITILSQLIFFDVPLLVIKLVQNEFNMCLILGVAYRQNCWLHSVQAHIFGLYINFIVHIHVPT